MKEKYIELMEKVLSAYTDEHIKRYFEDVKNNGLTEHGFPRLTANIGILIAHGRRCDLMPIFLEMMDFCCETIPHVDAANDFSVREIISCIKEIESNQIIGKEIIDHWKNNLSKIDPYTCYTVKAKSPDEKLKNWALFTALSEYFRQDMGLCDSTDFVDIQLATQLQWLDENGMYMDHPEDIHQPIVYDLVPRALFSLLLNQGYNGKYRKAIDDALKKAGLLTLKMQSPNGEIPFGGRSNQFLHNEPWMITILEYEAKRYARAGNFDLALRFKSASAKALAVTENWLAKQPIRHIKNRFPTETQYGCESYAYFDKYMITTASILYMAYLICDNSIPNISAPDYEPCIAETSEHFHKLFMKCGGYGLEFEFNADTHYESNGLGRIHRDGAPSTICLSGSCPSNPGYYVDITDYVPLSLCSMIKSDGQWLFASDGNTNYEITESREETNCVKATLLCHFDTGETVKESYTVCEKGVSITLEGNGEIGFALPAFLFDGENHPTVTVNEHNIEIAYGGWICRYTTDSAITDFGKAAVNRNGHYGIFAAHTQGTLNVNIEIFQQ